MAATVAMLLVDGAFLALATYATGGATSSLRFLLYLQLIAVSLLVSYRAGLLDRGVGHAAARRAAAGAGGRR